MTVHISRENIITHLLTTPMFEELEPAEIGEKTPVALNGRQITIKTLPVKG